MIFIVVIGILAAISIVAFNGISQRAHNTSVVDAASKAVRLAQAYVAQEGTYPLPGPATGHACVTTQSGCHRGTASVAASAVFDGNITSVGQPPRSVSNIGDNRYGIYFTYWGSAGAGPFYLTYFLQGVNQQCGLSNVLNSGFSGLSTTGYTNGNVNSTGKTLCAILISGPPHG